MKWRKIVLDQKTVLLEGKVKKDPEDLSCYVVFCEIPPLACGNGRVSGSSLWEKNCCCFAFRCFWTPKERAFAKSDCCAIISAVHPSSANKSIVGGGFLKFPKICQFEENRMRDRPTERKCLHPQKTSVLDCNRFSLLTTPNQRQQCLKMSSLFSYKMEPLVVLRSTV